MPRTDTEQLREERRAQIIEAAIPLFAQHGLSQTKVSDIARRAGVSHGTVFLYFSTKDALFHASVLEPLSTFEQQFLIPGTEDDSPFDRIQQLVIDQVGQFARQGHYLRLTQYVLGQRDRFPELAIQLFAFAERARDRMVPVIKAGQQAGELAEADASLLFWAYFSYLSGLGLVIQDTPEEPSWQAFTEHGIRLFGPLKPIRKLTKPKNRQASEVA